MIVVFLTCKDESEADSISSTLLHKRLVACAKKVPVDSKFWWDKKIDSASEVLVMFETLEEKYKLIEKEVEKVHSYEIPMLFSIPVLNTSKKVNKWLHEEIK